MPWWIFALVMQILHALEQLALPGEEVTVPVPPAKISTHGKVFEVSVHIKRDS